MQLDVKTLSTYRLNRSKEDLEAAISNHESGCNPETNLSKPFDRIENNM